MSSPVKMRRSRCLAHPVGAVREHGRRAHPDADGVDHHVVVMGLRVLREFVGDDRLHAGADAESAEAFGEMHPRQSVVVLFSAKGELVDLIGMRFFEQFARARAQIGFGDFLMGHR